jgi:hypothetical protein
MLKGHDAVISFFVMTLSAVDRPAHHSTIFEMNTESFRRKTVGGFKPTH